MSAVVAPAPAQGPRQELIRPVLRLLWVLLPHRTLFIRSTGCLLLAQLSTTAVSALAALLVARVVTDGSDAARAGVLLLSLVLVVTAHGGFVWLESWWSHVLAYRILADLRVDLHEGLERVAPGGAQHQRTGESAGSVMADVEVLEWFYAHTAGATFCAVVTPTVLSTLLVVIVGPPGLVVIAGALVLLVVPVLSAPLQARQGAQMRAELGHLKALVLEGVQGLRELVVLGAVQAHSRRVAAVTERVQGRQRASAVRGGLEAAVSDLVLASVTLAFLVLLARQVRTGELDLTLLPLAMVLMGATLAPVTGVLTTAARLGEVSASARRVLAVLDAPATVHDGADDIPRATVTTRPAQDPAASSRGALDLHGVRFHYEGGVEEVLRGVELTVEAGSTIALVGASGAGKSTLAHLLVRFWDPTEGTIRLDGQRLADRSLADLRREVGLVQQHSYVFRASVRDNLHIALPGADDAALWHGLEAAALVDVVQALPGGLDHVVGEQGSTLSGGQRQRLALARAFLLDPAVLVMDEPLAHLDAGNEDRLAASTARLRAGRTTVVIAHRLSTIRQAGRVVLLDGGVVAADGSHEHLVATSPSYRSVLARQLAEPGADPTPGRRAPVHHTGQTLEGGD